MVSKGYAGKILYFNIVMVVLFILSSIYVGIFISTQINEIQGFHGESATIPYVESYGFVISVSHISYFNDGNQTLVNLGPLPTTIPNYPVFISVIVFFVDAYFVVKVRRSKE